jgi:hypothetical protein
MHHGAVLMRPWSSTCAARSGVNADHNHGYAARVRFVEALADLHRQIRRRFKMTARGRYIFPMWNMPKLSNTLQERPPMGSCFEA